MPTIPLHPPSSTRSSPYATPLPQLLQTPSGLAILELQGSINMPAPPASSTAATEIGRLEFPDYDASNEADTKWMQRVYLYIGLHQRLTGEVKKLGKPLGVVRRRQGGEGGAEEVEVVEVVRFKIVFLSRPEPVGGELEAVDEA